ncbi:MAG TPA: hypothetical protein VHE79_14200 [Spirochaetia bacterium]
MRKTIIVVLVLFAAACPFWASAQDVQQFSIRYFDQKVYFLGDPIQVEAVITNTGTDTLRFKVADNRFFNLDFDVRTTTNVGLEHAKQFTIERNSDQPVFFREVSLEPGEKYGIVVDLTKFAGFSGPGQYVVQATFFPELFRGADSASMRSNRLSLNVKPPVATAEEKAVVEAETGALIARQVLPPDEVVRQTIGARQKSQWERFFLYLDLESLMRKNPEKDRSFRNATESAQRQMLDQFRQQLRQTKIRDDISVIPSSFDVQKTTYDASEATVTVLERFKYPDYTELKTYTYHLKKSDRYWIIYDYEIRNQGTE